MKGTPPRAPRAATSARPAPPLPALEFLDRIQKGLSGADAKTFRDMIERLEKGERFERAINLRADWRRYERDRLFRLLRESGLTPAMIADWLRGARGAGKRDPEQPKADRAIMRLQRLCARKPPSLQHIRRLTREQKSG